MQYLSVVLFSERVQQAIWSLLTKMTKRSSLDSSDGKESACNAGDLGLISGSERSPGEGHGYLLQCWSAWRISWTEEPGRPQSMGLQTV